MERLEPVQGEDKLAGKLAVLEPQGATWKGERWREATAEKGTASMAEWE